MRTLEEIKALNAERLAEGARDRAEDFATQQAIDDNNWLVYLNEFILAHTGRAGIERDSLFESKESNTHVLLMIAKEMGLRPSLSALEQAWTEGITTGKLLPVPGLPQEDKDVIVKKYLIEKYKLGPRNKSTASESERRPLDETLSQLKLTDEEWKAAWAAAEVACAPAFRRAAASRDVKPVTTGSRIVPQVFKPELPSVTIIPECVRHLTYLDLMTMKSDEQLRMMRVPGAKEYMQEIINKHRRGSR
jgi:hypothetical protein